MAGPGPDLPGFPEALRDRYTPLRVLGSGGMGTVYLAHSAELDRPVAVKAIRAGAGDAGARLRFAREARALTRLKAPGLPVIYEYLEDPGGDVPCLVMEYLDGPDLATQGPRMDPAARVEAMLRVAEALGEVHRAGLVHRDVKPANIVVTGDGRVVLTDFGLVWDPRRTRLTEHGHVVGTFAYIAPEQLDGRLPGPAADWYAWGASLFVLLEGRPPYAPVDLIETYKGRALPPLRFAAIPPGGPMAGLLRAALDAAPAARPASPHQVRVLLGTSGEVPARAAIEESLGTAPVPRALEELRLPPPPPVRFPAAALGLTLLGLAAIGSLGRAPPAPGPGPGRDPTPGDGSLEESTEALAGAIEELERLADRIAARVRAREPGADKEPLGELVRAVDRLAGDEGRDPVGRIREWLERERGRASRRIAEAGTSGVADGLVRVLERLVPIADALGELGAFPGLDPRDLLAVRLPVRVEPRSAAWTTLRETRLGGVGIKGPWLLCNPGLDPEERTAREGLTRMADSMTSVLGDMYTRERDGWLIHPALRNLVTIPAAPGAGAWALVLHQVDAWLAWKLRIQVDLEALPAYLPASMVRIGSLRMGSDMGGSGPDYTAMPTVRIPLPPGWTTPGPHELQVTIEEPPGDVVGRVSSDFGATVRIGWVTLEPEAGGPVAP